jgi:hypothetical protein
MLHFEESITFILLYLNIRIPQQKCIEATVIEF